MIKLKHIYISDEALLNYKTSDEAFKHYGKISIQDHKELKAELDKHYGALVKAQSTAQKEHKG